MATETFIINLDEYRHHSNRALPITAFESLFNKEAKIVFDSKVVGTAIVVDITGDEEIIISTTIPNNTMESLTITNKLGNFSLLPRCVGRHMIVDGKVQCRVTQVVAFDLVPQVTLPHFMANEILKMQIRDFFDALINITTVRGIAAVNPDDSYGTNEVILQHLAKEPAVKQVLGAEEETAWEALLERLERTALPTLSTISPALSKTGVALLHLYVTKRLISGIPPIELAINRYGFECKNRQIMEDIDNQIILIASQFMTQLEDSK